MVHSPEQMFDLVGVMIIHENITDGKRVVAVLLVFVLALIFSFQK